MFALLAVLVVPSVTGPVVLIVLLSPADMIKPELMARPVAPPTVIAGPLAGLTMSKALMGVGAEPAGAVANAVVSPGVGNPGALAIAATSWPASAPPNVME